jgi:hypothetical protein
MSVAEEAHRTSQERMGGEGVSFGQAAQLEAYIAWSRPVVRPTATPARPTAIACCPLRRRPDAPRRAPGRPTAGTTAR